MPLSIREPTSAPRSISSSAEHWCAKAGALRAVDASVLTRRPSILASDYIVWHLLFPKS